MENKDNQTPAIDQPTEPEIIQPTINQSSPLDNPANVTSQVPMPVLNQPKVAADSAQPPIVSQPLEGNNRPKKRRRLKIVVPVLIVLALIIGGVGYALYKNHKSYVTESGTVKTPYGTVSGTYSGPAYPEYTTIGNVQGRVNDGISLLNSIASSSDLPIIDSSKTGSDAWDCASVVTAAGKLSVYTGKVTSKCYIFNIKSSATIKSLAPGFYASAAAQSSNIKISPFPNQIENDAIILEEGRVCDSSNSYHGTSNDTLIATTPGAFALLTTQENQLHKYIWVCNDSGS